MISLIEQTWQTLLAHRMKSALAIVAIAWGVIAVVVLIALGEGFYRQQTLSLSFMVNNVQVAFPARTSKPWHGQPARREVVFTQDNVDKIKQAGLVKKTSSVYAKQDADVTNSKGQYLSSSVSGIDSHYFPLVQRQFVAGSRNISPSDLHNHTKVAVLGDQIATMGNIGIGEQVKVNGIPFLVIGVIKDEDAGITFGESRGVFIPQTTYLDMWNDKPWMLLLKPADGVAAASMRQSIVHFFAEQLHFDPEDKEAIHLPDFSEGAAMITGLFRGIQLFLAASGAMTMAVGALGVANIMFLSVTERTREIGVRLAIGATQKTIRSQFILEGFILVAIGTSIGLLLAHGVIALLRSMALPEWIGSPVITASSIGWSLLVTFVLALLASYFPARRASRLTPVIALSARA